MATAASGKLSGDEEPQNWLHLLLWIPVCATPNVLFYQVFRLGCSDTSDAGHHLQAVIIEDSDAEMEHEEPLPSLDSPGDGVTVVMKKTCFLLEVPAHLYFKNIFFEQELALPVSCNTINS